jgi:hypothetical protein
MIARECGNVEAQPANLQLAPNFQQVDGTPGHRPGQLPNAEWRQDPGKRTGQVQRP